jgi:hypothetical protein
MELHMINDLPALTNTTFNELMARARTDTALKARMLQIIETSGVEGLGMAFFTLTANQHKILSHHKKVVKGMHRMVAESIKTTLEAGGIVKLKDLDPKLRIGCSLDVIVFPDGTTEVSISCEI